jgi:hypothetical protein
VFGGATENHIKHIDMKSVLLVENQVCIVK